MKARHSLNFFLTLFLFLLSFNLLKAQNIVLRFTGLEEENFSHLSCDSIYIRNINQGIDTILRGNDTILELTVTATEDVFCTYNNFELSQNYPNPFTNNTNFALKLNRGDNVYIEASNISGQKAASYKGYFSSGLHLFSFSGASMPLYIITARNSQSGKSIKLINHKKGSTDKPLIQYIAYKPLTAEEGQKKSAQHNKDGFAYNPGDELQYAAFASGHKISVLYDSPVENTDYEFVFRLPDDFVCGESFIDKRDGKAYNTVKLGNQCWMAENLNIGEKIPGNNDQENNMAIEKYCYNDEESNCDSYGGLYQWDEMMQYDTTEYLQGICPEGWHLPRIDEWNTLIDNTGGPLIAGEALKAGGSSGFEALMSGYRNTESLFAGLGNESYLWATASGNENTSAFYSLSSSSASVNTGFADQYYGYAVRCVKGLPPIVKENVVVIDTTVYTLISDSIELSLGLYIYQYNLKKKSSDIQASDVIIGIREDAYLRKVEMLEDNPPLLSLHTGPATLEDVFQQLEIHEFFDATDEDDGNSPPMLNFSANGLTIFNQGGLEVIAEELSLNYEPDFFFDCVVEEGVCKYLTIQNAHSLIYHSLINYSSNTGINGVFSKNVGPKYKKRIWLSQFVGFPLWITFKAGLNAGLSIDYENALSLTAGYNDQRTFNAGLTYDNGHWEYLWEKEHESNFSGIEYSESNNGELQLSFGPEISLMLYGIAGPFVWAGAYSQYVEHFNTGNFGDRDKSFTAGLGVNAGVKAEIEFSMGNRTIFSWIIGRYEKQLAGIEIPLWTLPSEILMSGGNMQQGFVNEALAEAIEVMVTDNQGTGFPNIPVHFSVSQGGGSLSEYDVLTDEEGYAQTSWTLGPEAGENILAASVKHADGSHIINSPIHFTANAIENYNLPVVSTTNISDTSQTSATSGGNVINEGSSPVIARGVCWDNAPEPGLNNEHTIDGEGPGEFTSLLSGLSPDTEYYVRAYAQNQSGTAFGNEIIFTTNAAGEACPGIAVVNYGGQDYNTVLIGNKCWLKENLNIGSMIDGNDQMSDNGIIEKYCYNDEPQNCDLYGGLYQWDEMMQYTNQTNAQGICPEGWHIPTHEIWLEMQQHIGGINQGNSIKSCRQLDSPLGGDCNTSEHPRWDFFDDELFGTDEWGFAALPGGNHHHYHGSGFMGEEAVFWSSSSFSDDEAYDWQLSYMDNEFSVGMFLNNKFYGLSVRCMKYLNNGLPGLNTSDISNLGESTAQSGGEIFDQGTSEVIARGVCWSTEQEPDLNDNFTTDGSGPGAYTSLLTMLEDSTIYYVRAYATNSSGTAYGDEKSFMFGGGSGEACHGMPTISFHGRIYHTTYIGKQCWLNESLNVGIRINGSESMANNSSLEKYCMNDDESLCDEYGAMYQWNEMMQYTTQAGSQGICPDGWHIPTDDEWKILEGTIDSLYGIDDPEWDKSNEWRGYDAGKKLKATEGWHNNGNGTDEYNFTVKPGGERRENGSFLGNTFYNKFWSSTEAEEAPGNFPWAWGRDMGYSIDGIQRYDFGKTSGFYVRCLRD